VGKQKFRRPTENRKVGGSTPPLATEIPHPRVCEGKPHIPRGKCAGFLRKVARVGRATWCRSSVKGFKPVVPIVLQVPSSKLHFLNVNRAHQHGSGPVRARSLALHRCQRRHGSPTTGRQARQPRLVPSGEGSSWSVVLFAAMGPTAWAG